MKDDYLYEMFGDDQAELIIEHLAKAEELATSEYHLEPVYSYHYNINPSGSELLEIIKQALISIIATYHIDVDESVDYKIVLTIISILSYLRENPYFIEQGVGKDPIVMFDLVNTELGEPLVYNDTLTLYIEVSDEFFEYFYSKVDRLDNEPNIIDEMKRRVKILEVYNNLTNMLNDSQVFKDLTNKSVLIYDDADLYLEGISDEPKIRCIDVAVAIYVVDGDEVTLGQVESIYQKVLEGNFIEEYKCVKDTIANISTLIEEKINEVE